MIPDRDPSVIVEPESPVDPEVDADVPEAADLGEGQHVVLLSGLSGAGKTAAAKLFEDLGYAVVDNLPGELLPELAELVADDPERFRKVGRRPDGVRGDAWRPRGSRDPAAGLLPRGP